MPKTKNRWFIALSAVGIHLSIGSIYAYSVMVKPLESALGWTKTDISTSFSIAILFLGLSAAFLGKVVEKKGPKFSGILTAFLYGFGIVGSGLAVKLSSLPLFILSFGVIGGMGLGLGYITPVSTLVKWFPKHRGLATGMAIMGFGFSSMIFGPTMTYLFDKVGIHSTFFILGSLYFIVILCSSLYIEPPLKADDTKTADQSAQPAKIDLAQLTANEALKTTRFYYIWLMLFINITCGIALISVASPMAQDQTGMTAAQAATVVGLMGLFNGLGRIGWASLSDWLGRPTTYLSFFIIQIIAFLILPNVHSQLLFQAIIFLIITCYGGGFSSVPAFLGDLFGTKELSAIHGFILTAWAAAGIVGPTLVAQIREQTGSYEKTLQIFVMLLTLAFVVTILMMIDIRKKRAIQQLEMA